jgi:hypothetical protein
VITIDETNLSFRANSGLKAHESLFIFLHTVILIIYLLTIINIFGARGSIEVKALYCKPEGRRVKSR